MPIYIYALMKKLIGILLFMCIVYVGFAQQPALKKVSDEKVDSLVQKFYTINHEPLYWLSTRKIRKGQPNGLLRLRQRKNQAWFRENS